MADKQTDGKGSTEKEEALIKSMIKSLDNILATGDWEATLFLRANKKRLEELRARGEALLIKIGASSDSSRGKLREAPPGYKTVYISLYQSEPNNLAKWQNTIRALEKYSVSRPVYWEEEHVRAMIRSKIDPSKEAYVIAFVKETDIVKPYLGKKVQDRFGHELITLRESAIDLFKVITFIHDNRRYSFFPDTGLVLL